MKKNELPKICNIKFDEKREVENVTFKMFSTSVVKSKKNQDTSLSNS